MRGTALFELCVWQISRFLGGVVLATDYEAGTEMMAEHSYQEHEGFFQDVLEIVRRHKIMNPEKMRTEYAKVQAFFDRNRRRQAPVC